MAARVSLFLAVLVLITLDLGPTAAAGMISPENTLKSDGANMEAPIKPDNDGKDLF
jgi:hypothetical protein